MLEILGDAQMYQQHSGRQKIDISDIRMAIQTKMNFCFLQPPQREVRRANIVAGVGTTMAYVCPGAACGGS